MKLTLLLVILLAAAGLVFVRLAPSDPVRWHIDPMTAADPGSGGVLISPDAAPEFEESPASLIRRFDAVALAEPRTHRLAGDPDALHVTYVVRSKWLGFPDYITVRALPDADGASLAVLARSRFGTSDLGVNRARLARWLEAL